MTTLITHIVILHKKLDNIGHLGGFNNQEELPQHNHSYLNKLYKSNNLNKN
jgi:hypothetical protein